MKVIIKEFEVGLYFKKGKFIKPLLPGRHFLFGGEVEELYYGCEIVSSKCPLKKLIDNQKFAQELEVLRVPDNKCCIHIMNGKLEGFYTEGIHAFLKNYAEHEFIFDDLKDPQVSVDLPTNILEHIKMRVYDQIIEEYEKGYVFVNGKYLKTLEPGKHSFWDIKDKVEILVFDSRWSSTKVSCRNALTKDNVQLYVECALKYRNIDDIEAIRNIYGFTNQLYQAVQMSINECVGKRSYEEILINRDELNKSIMESVKKREKELYFEVAELGLVGISQRRK